MSIAIVQDKFPQSAINTEKQVGFSAIIFLFYWECVCFMVTYHPTNGGSGIWSHFLLLPDSSFYQKHAFGRFLETDLHWSHRKLTSM